MIGENQSTKYPKKAYTHYVSLEQANTTAYHFITSYNLAIRGFTFEEIAKQIKAPFEEVRKLLTDKDIYQAYFPNTAQEKMARLEARLENIDETRANFARKVVKSYYTYHGNLNLMSEKLKLEGSILRSYLQAGTYKKYLSEEECKTFFRFMLEQSLRKNTSSELEPTKLEGGKQK